MVPLRGLEWPMQSLGLFKAKRPTSGKDDWAAFALSRRTFDIAALGPMAKEHTSEPVVPSSPVMDTMRLSAKDAGCRRHLFCANGVKAVALPPVIHRTSGGEIGRTMNTRLRNEEECGRGYENAWQTEVLERWEQIHNLPIRFRLPRNLTSSEANRPTQKDFVLSCFWEGKRQGENRQKPTNNGARTVLLLVSGLVPAGILIVAMDRHGHRSDDQSAGDGVCGWPPTSKDKERSLLIRTRFSEEFGLDCLAWGRFGLPGDGLAVPEAFYWSNRASCSLPK
ncbi:hypothetical protein CCM_06816 [Cordyceps militaris CM01]|uniref:Uncharacterized protein n=1 Tax=Cordyceps militaris (strain CM01) TaxID=983644 RepID=G3JL22_CORMM|nr:uncharacterized protein CCM_06816 [Cordyceps militaris CM01]EGX90396.1 hypothetical protein CCM_06816 [Cordyceps militaris CM01]